ncbi:MAG: RNA 2',3'-cyclic phosphodiesterase [Nitrosomonas sp.]|nr:RNA 2',3'-cyclic phosphodiesterase [Nitrosomonas sp.]
MTDKHTNIKKNTIRAFFAIRPDEAALKQLDRIAKQIKATCGGQKTTKSKIHLTLLFLGNIDIDQLDRFRVVAGSVRASSFNFSIEEIRYWKHNHIVYAGSNKHHPELLNLVTKLRSALSFNGVLFDQRAFVPHITLVRKVSHPTLPDLAKPISWLAHEWLLVQSKQTCHGAVYIPLYRWLLNH